MKSPTYQLKGMICYVGAHYITYFRTLPEESKDDLYSIGKWKIYNDDQVKEMFNWEDIIKESCAMLIKPTIIFYTQKKDSLYSSTSGSF